MFKIISSPKSFAKRFKRKESAHSRPPYLIIGLFSALLIVSTVGLINDIGTWGGLRPFGFLGKIISVEIAQREYLAYTNAANTQKLFSEDTPDRCQIMNPAYDGGYVEYWPGWTMYSGESKFGVGQAIYKEWDKLETLDESPCGSDEIDFLSYLLPKTPATVPIERQKCTLSESSKITFGLDFSQIVRGKVGGSKEGFYMRGSQSFAAYKYDNENIYVYATYGPTTTCADKVTRAYTRFFNEGEHRDDGGLIPRCIKPLPAGTSYFDILNGVSVSYDQSWSSQAFKLDEEGNFTDESCGELGPAGTAHIGLFKVEGPDDYGPIADGLKDTIYTVVAGAGIWTYYSKDEYGRPLGPTAQYSVANSGVIANHSRLNADEEDPAILWCGKNAPPEIEAALQPISANTNFPLFEKFVKTSLKQMDKSWPNCDFDSCIYPASDKSGVDVLRADFEPGGSSSTLTKTSSTGGGTAGMNMAGTNTGMVVDNGVQEGQKFIDYSVQMGFSYVLGMVSGPNVGGAADFVNKANEAGLIPIVRLCWPGAPCGFKSASDMSSFFQGVYGATSGKFIAVLGPNEPGSNGEIFNFVGGSYDSSSGVEVVPPSAYNTMVSWTNQAARDLQGMRDRMFLAPAIFNIANPVNNDPFQYLDPASGRSEALDTGLFDYFLGNVYIVGGVSAYDQYQQYMTKYASLPVIITETGIFSGGSVEQLKDDFSKFCSDPQIKGVLFFRSFAEFDEIVSVAPPQRPEVLLTSEEIATVLEGCGGAGTPGGGTGGQKDSTSAYACGKKDYNFKRAMSFEKKEGEVLAESTDGSCNVAKIGDSISHWPAYLPGSVDLAFNGAGADWFVGRQPKANPNAAKYFNDLTGDGIVSVPDGTYKVTAAVVMLGTNDCGGGGRLGGFTTDLTDIVTRLNDAGIHVFLNTFPQRTAIPCPDGEENFIKAIRDIASSTGATLIDVYSIPASELALTDGIHPGDYSAINALINSKIYGYDPACALPSLPIEAKDFGEVPSGAGIGADLIEYTPEAALKIVCEGAAAVGVDLYEVSYDSGTYKEEPLARQFCYTKKLDTVEVKMPIKSFGGDAGFGTSTRPYTEICAEAAAIVSGSSGNPLDAMNQYAGGLSSSSGVYPMAWLGSAINCAAELAKYNYLNFSQFGGLLDFPVAGTFMSESSLELEDDIKRDIAKTVSKGYSVSKYNSEKGKDIIPNERAYYFDTYSPANNKYQEKRADKGNLGLSKLFRDYNPYEVPVDYASITDTQSVSGSNSCSSTKVITALSENDYITGAEVALGSEKKEWGAEPNVKTESDACWLYAQRNNSGEGQGEVIGVPHTLCKIKAGSILRQYINEFEYLDTYCSEASAVCSPNEITEGTCALSEAYKYCFEYDYNLLVNDDQAIYHRTESFASIPEYSIPELYDALHRMYLSLQSELGSRGVQIVYRENIGWETIVSTKIRDAGRNVENMPDYAYSQDFSDSCSVPEMADNSTPLAKLDPIKSEKYIYDWAGYLDLMQEWRMVYANNTSLPAESYHKNPLYDSSKEDKIVYQKPRILISHLANYAPATDLLSCDQIEICKEKTQDELVGFYQQEEGLSESEARELAFLTCPFDEKLDEGVELTCITDLGSTSDPGRGVCLGGEGAGESSSSIASKLDAGGVVITLVPDSFDVYASAATAGRDSIMNFVINGVDFATNSNYFLSSTGQQIGLVGTKGDFNYFEESDILSGASKRLSRALLFHNGNIDSIKSLEGLITASNEDYALVDIESSAFWDRTDAIVSELESSGIVTASVTGWPWLVENGVPLYDRIDLSTYYFQEFRPRTIIGWKATGELVVSVISTAGLEKTISVAKSLGLVNAIALDGGGSSQMYSKGGFETGVDPAKIIENGKVYYPSVGLEPLRVTDFLGFKLKDGGTPTDSFCMESTEGLYFDKLGYELCQRGYIIPGVCEEYYCAPGKDDAPSPTTDTGTFAVTTNVPKECGTNTAMSCPIHDTERFFSQRYDGEATHTLPGVVHQHATDINGGTPTQRNPNSLVYPAVNGTVTTIYNPKEATSILGSMFCAFTIKNEETGEIIEGPKFSDGSYYFDGGFEVFVTGDDGNTYAYIHLEDLQIKEGARVTIDKPLGKVFDGEFEGGEFDAYDAQGGCAGKGNPHVHFYIVDAETMASDPSTYLGNKINSTFCIADACEKGVGLPVQPPGATIECKPKSYSPIKIDYSSVKATKQYESIDCLINDIATFMGVPPSLQKSIMLLETGWDVTTGEITGDPSAINREVENEVTAMGPLQFTRGAWDRIVKNEERKQELLSCIDHIGLEGVEPLGYEDRAIVGVAICANAIFIKLNLDTHMDSSYIGGGALLQAVIAEVTSELGPEYAVVDKDYYDPAWGEESVKISAYHQLGICKTLFSLKLPDGSVTGDYCDFVFEWEQKFRGEFDGYTCKIN